MRFVSLYRVCVVALLPVLCACSTHRAVGSSRLFSRETVLAFYALAPGEEAPGALYHRAMTFAPTVLFVADASRGPEVWSALTPATDAPGLIPAPEKLAAVNVGVVNVTQIAGLREFLGDAARREQTLAEATHTLCPWKVMLLPEPVLSESVYEGFDELARLIEQHGALLAIAPGKGYLRSRPVGSIAATAVRYIALPADPAASPVRAPWLTPSIQGGRYAILRAAPDRLRWSLYNADGKLLDLVVVRLDKRADGASDFILTSEATALMKYGTGEETEQP